ncbi:MAG: zinc metallopeptidase [Opitutales bacterium]
MTTLLFLILPTMLLAFWAQSRVMSTYKKWVNVRSRGGITGVEAASAILRSAGIHDVQIEETGGQLTDHYDPVHKKLRLSQMNYRGSSLAALGVAAHEAGHAIQHAQGYFPLKIRAALIPATSFASQILPFVLIGGFFLNMAGLIWVGVAAYLILTIFQLITLPVEFDASKRATAQLAGLGIIGQDERTGVVQTLNAAGWTYVAAFVTSLAWLLHFLMIALSSRE